jgi:hypothetical protein
MRISLMELIDWRVSGGYAVSEALIFDIGSLQSISRLKDFVTICFSKGKPTRAAWTADARAWQRATAASCSSGRRTRNA